MSKQIISIVVVKNNILEDMRVFEQHDDQTSDAQVDFIENEFIDKIKELRTKNLYSIVSEEDREKFLDDGYACCGDNTFVYLRWVDVEYADEIVFDEDSDPDEQ